MLKKLNYSILFCSVALASLQANQTNLSKKYFTSDTSKKAFTHKVRGLNDEQLDHFILGKSFFRIPWVEAPSATTARDGLGPLFNANTCTSCHPNNGVSSVYNGKGIISRGYVSKVSNKNNYDKNYGEQIAINGIFGVPYEAKQKVVYKQKKVVYPDGEIVFLSQPLQANVYKLENLQYGELEKGTTIANRIAPALIGLGLIEQIKKEDILSYADENDTNNDGISGRAHFVYSRDLKRVELGRFTTKASQATLKEQVAHAALNDMGLTNPLYFDESCTKNQKECLEAPKADTLRAGTPLDLPELRLDAMSYYLANLKVPKRKIKEKEGEKLFSSLGCVKCHVNEYTLENGLKISPFSDFLLHDMGEGLSDNRVEFDALATEFRTKPLWGIGLYNIALGREANFLHDGRAKTIEEAILWHGGEAQQIKENFKNLNKKQRKALIAYIKEL